MEISVNHHDGSKSVILESGRTLRLSKDVYNGIMGLRGAGAVFNFYMMQGSSYFVGGWGAQEAQWLKAWDAYFCNCGHSGVADAGSKCPECGAWVNRREARGNHQPFVDGNEYTELVCGLNGFFGKFDRTKNDDGTTFRAVKIANIRTTGVWQVWKDSITGTTHHVGEGQE